MEFAALDLRHLMGELQQLEEGFVQKVYQRGEELTLEVYVPGDEKKRLIIGTSYAFLSEHRRENPERPPGFCMELRKHLGRVDAVRQRGFDRILEVESGDHTLVCELFGKGNFILLDGERIIGALRQMEFADRKILVGEEYEPPEPASDPAEMEEPVSELSGELVRSLASDLSLGGTYAEEVVARTGLEKDWDVSELEEGELEEVKRALEKVLGDEKDPVLYRDGEKPERAAPFRLETYSDFDKEEHGSFSSAVDELVYTRQTREKERRKEEKYRERREGLEQQLQQQERKIEGLDQSSGENRRRAELIYENYRELEEIKSAVEEGIEQHGWEETERRFEESEEELTEMVTGFQGQEGFFTVDLGENTVKLRPGEDLEAAASRYYDNAKESEQKMERAEQALEETRRELEELEEEEFEAEEQFRDSGTERSKKWFEKYRWFRTSEDHLVCIGRDAQTNEMLVKSHMEDGDLYFHADFDGAPSVVLKDGREAGEDSRLEAARAAVTFSKTWKAGIGAGTAYCVEPEQVTKQPESGEYLEKGSFVIRGEREYYRNVEVDAAVGPYELDGDKVPMCGPYSAVEENCPVAIQLGQQGGSKKSDAAKEIQRRLKEQGHELDLDYIVRALPPGKVEVE